ncbi:MAG: intradiol ring-cleavage dioxygenase [Chloroflexota bacterium]|nr:intradiol ring-cleavage dioxygenase [Chloroflexota bacterium]
MNPGDQSDERLDAARNLSGDALTQAVLASFDQSSSPRFRQLAQSLVRHLHAFVRETGLTEEEWAAGIGFLTRVGHITTEQRQEFILLSDVLGVSMQVIGVNHPATGAATESTVFGPFFVQGSPLYACGDDLANGAPGEPCYLAGQIRSTSGAPVPEARIEVWQADEDGHYDVQYADLPAARGRGHLLADAEGRYHFWSVLPSAYPIPDDGPVGDLLTAARRSPMRPAHVHFMITAPDYQSLTTHVFAHGDRYLDSDAVFGVKSSLIAPFTRHEPGVAPDGKRLDRPYYTLRYDFILTPAAN